MPKLASPTCTKCGTAKTESNCRRYKSGKRQGKFSSWCKSCHKEYREINKPRRREYAIRKALERKVRVKYGLSIEQYRKVMESSNGKCELCESSTRRLCLDHDHKTGKIRGVLCHLCNSGLGYFQDSAELTAKAAHYLIREDDWTKFATNTGFRLSQENVLIPSS